MKRVLLVMAILAIAAVGVAVAYQAAQREREYRELMAQGDSAQMSGDTLAAIEDYSGALVLRPDSTLATSSAVKRTGSVAIWTTPRAIFARRPRSTLRRRGRSNNWATRSTSNSATKRRSTPTTHACGWTTVQRRFDIESA